MTRGKLIAAAVILIIAVALVSEARVRRAQRAGDEAAGRYQQQLEELTKRDEAVKALLPALEARDRDLVERLVASQQREKALTEQLAVARQASAVAADRAEALKTAPLADVLREGERLGIKARAR